MRPGLAALDNLDNKFVAGWLLPSKVLDLSYPTPPLPLLVFAMKVDNWLAGVLLQEEATVAKTQRCGKVSITERRSLSRL